MIYQYNYYIISIIIILFGAFMFWALSGKSPLKGQYDSARKAGLI